MDKTDLEKQFSFDILYLGAIRTRLLVTVVLMIVGAMLINGYVNNEALFRIYSDRRYLIVGIGLFLLLAFRSVIISFVMKRIFKKIGQIPLKARYFNVFFEMTIPSIVIALLAGQANPVNILVSPIAAIYFVLILLSVLEMDFRISVFAGIVGGIEYYSIAIYYMDQINSPDSLPFFNLPFYYLGRSFILIIAGFTAGKVGSLIRDRVMELYVEREKKDLIQRLFGQQLSAEVANELMDPQADMEGKSHNVCVMFLDIRGFTPMTANKSPQEIIAFQNAIFPLMIASVYENHGIINQLLGDGFMATFGAPVSVGNDCQNAVDASLSILKKLEIRNQEDHNTPTHVGIGLHYGMVVTGNVGSEIRKQYSVTGQTVIISSRIEELNKEYNSSFLLSQDVFDHLDQQPESSMSLGPVPIKGLANPIDLIQVI